MKEVYLSSLCSPLNSEGQASREESAGMAGMQQAVGGEAGRQRGGKEGGLPAHPQWSEHRVEGHLKGIV